MGDNSAFDPVPEADERFTLRSRAEIVAVLRSLANQNAMITVYFDQGREFILTTILDVNPEFQELVFDLGADTRANTLLLQSSRLLVVGYEDHIKVQFATSFAQATTHAGHPAFRVRIPGALVRLQRRDFYRIQLPLGKPIKAYLQPYADHTETLIEARVVDLSCGGIAMTLAAPAFPLEVGSVYPACSINLPAVGTVSAPVEIRNFRDVALKNGSRERRAGCHFIGLPGAMQTMIQRYINQAERERHLLRR
jgi:c-di-GMP-binding flagellar brake protein YcgR